MSDTQKHTPGPWHIGVKPGPMIYGPAGEQIADMADPLLTEAENIANARFIAAAPETAAERDRLREVNADMLAALEGAKAALVAYGAENGATYKGVCAAIARAKGAA